MLEGRLEKVKTSEAVQRNSGIIGTDMTIKIFKDGGIEQEKLNTAESI